MLRKVDAELMCPHLQACRSGCDTDQLQHEFVAQALVTRERLQPLRLLEHGLGRHAHQLGMLAHYRRVTTQANHTDDSALCAQGQVDACPCVLQAARHGLVDLDRARLGEHEQGAIVAGTDSRAVAAGDDEAALVHHIDVGAQDLHRAIDDGLCK